MGRLLAFKTEREDLHTAIVATMGKELPIRAYVQLYPRVSTPEQKKNVSAEMQQDKKFALRCGWIDELIIMDTRDLGLSGQLRMEDRPAFSDMITRIAEGKIKIIIAANVSRLFRDRWGKEYSRFMEICYTYSVKVVIPNKTRTGIEYIYDFSKTSDVEAFRRKCEEAWSYIENHIGMMHAYKDERGYSGCWVGGAISTGFTIDVRKIINGEENPHYQKYIPYQPWAVHVARLLTRYRELCGNINELFRELERTNFLFPPVDESFPKELYGCIAITPVYENPDAPDDVKIIKGYKIASLYGLTSILRNPANIGHLVYKHVIRYNNHPPIVDYMDFIYAFNRLSSTNLDGTPNTDYLERANRYVKRHATEKPAFLRNHIQPADEKTYTSYTEDVETKTDGRVPFYSFYERGGGVQRTLYTIAAGDVDRLVLARFVERLQTPSAEIAFADFLAEETAEQQAYLKRVKELQVHIEATKSLMVKLLRRLTLLDDEQETDKRRRKSQEDEEEKDLVLAVKKAYKEHKLELVRLETEYERLVTTGSEVEKRRSFKKLMRDAGEAWEEVVTREDIMELVDLFIVKVSLDWISPQFFTLTIFWKDDEWETDTAVCFKGGCPSPHWSQEEEAALRELYPSASGRELMERLPLRTLESIKVHAAYLGIRRNGRKKERQVRVFCLRDLEQMEKYTLDPDDFHWKAGARLVTPWCIVEGGNFAIGST